MNFLRLRKSRLRDKILSYFFTNPSTRLYLREMASILKEDPGNLSKELANLEKEGIFNFSFKGNQKHFYLNKQYPLYAELKSIIFKTVGVKGRLKDIIERAKGIQTAFIYGSYAAGKENTSSDIDLFVIGNPDEDSLIQEIESAEKVLKREINYSIYPLKEVKERAERGDSFIQNILKRPKIILKGTLDEI